MAGSNYSGTDLIAGGFIITRPVPRPTYFSADLLPVSILSLSGCIADFLPRVPGSSDVQDNEQQVEEKAAYWGLTSVQVRAIEGWVSQAYDDNRIGWPGFFRSLAAARNFVEWLESPLIGAVILGLGLDPTHRDEFLSEETVPGGGDTAVVASVRAGTLLPDGGQLLGWEVLGHEYGDFHSWLCSGIEVEAANQLGIRPNLLGFIEEGSQAEEVAIMVNREKLGEPVSYWSWAIVQYPLSVPQTESIEW